MAVISNRAPDEASPPAPLPWWNPRAWGQTFAALESPQYARFFWANFAFFFAMQMQMLLRGYLIYDLTGNPFDLGLISVTFAAPMLLLAPVAGVVADRFDRRTIIIVSQIIGLALTALTTALILTDAIRFWQLLVISLFSSGTMVFNMPARQAMVPSLVGPERLMNAIALMSGSMNVCRIVAPALAGLLVGPIGVGGAYIVTMACNVVAVLLFIGIRSAARAPRLRRSFAADFSEGIAYIRGNRLLLLLLLTGIVPMLLAMPHQNLLPVFAVSVWDTGAAGLGLLQTLAGIGGLAGAVVAANLGGVRRPGRVMIGAMILFGVFIALFALSPAFAPALILILCSELFAMVGQTLNNTIVQSSIPDAVRGRVMSLMMMTFGVTPLGTLPAGWVAEHYGVRVAVGGGGILLILFAGLLYVASPRLRSLASPSRPATGDSLRALKAVPGAAGD